MPAYHSAFNSASSGNGGGGGGDVPVVAGMALLPLKSKAAQALPPGVPVPGSANVARVVTDDTVEDIADEAIAVYRANSLFRNYEVLGPADRTLIYALLFVGDCLAKTSANLQASRGVLAQKDCQRALYTLAVGSFAIPGDGGFPLNALYPAPAGRSEADTLRGYMLQLRLEIVVRLTERMYQANLPASSTDSSTNAAPSKWWMNFAKRKFMNKSL